MGSEGGGWGWGGCSSARGVPTPQGGHRLEHLGHGERGREDGGRGPTPERLCADGTAGLREEIMAGAFPGDTPMPDVVAAVTDGQVAMSLGIGDTGGHPTRERIMFALAMAERIQGNSWGRTPMPVPRAPRMQDECRYHQPRCSAGWYRGGHTACSCWARRPKRKADACRADDTYPWWAGPPGQGAATRAKGKRTRLPRALASNPPARLYTRGVGTLSNPLVPGWTYGSKGLPRGPKIIDGEYYAEWPFDWMYDEHTLRYLDTPEWYLRTQVAQDRLARFALYSERVGHPQSGAVREVTTGELLFAIRYAGVNTWFIHGPESSHCGVCVVKRSRCGTCLVSDRGAVHWMACPLCADLRFGTGVTEDESEAVSTDTC